MQALPITQSVLQFVLLLVFQIARRLRGYAVL